MRALLALVMALTLLGCTTEEKPTPAPTPTPSQTPTETETPTESPPTETPTEQPQTLDWQPVDGPITDVVTVSGEWRLTLPEGGEVARIDGPDPRDLPPPGGYRFTDGFLDGQYAVVVAEHRRAIRPNRVMAIELASGTDVAGDVPTTTGGDYAYGSGLLVGATTQGRRYCLATTDLLAGRSSTGPCVPPGHGISNATVSPGGIAAMTFDDARPSCRTLNRVDGGFAPLAGVEECHGWEAVVSETFAIWGVVPDERRIESSDYYLDNGAGPVELGPGTSGTLTWCGEAAYVVRDPQRGDQPARLLRIDPSGETEVVYESPGTGRAFLSAPRCGGTDLTLTAYSAAGDEQVTASVG